MPKFIKPGVNRDWIVPLWVAFLLLLIAAVIFDSRDSSIVEYHNNLEYEKVQDPTPLKGMFIPEEQVNY